jgi:glutamate-5-semialdehyde dehydrogenase
MSQLAEHVLDLGRRARAASRGLAKLSRARKDAALVAMADSLLAGVSKIIEANERDVSRAVAKGLAGPMLDRLRLDVDRVMSMSHQIRDVAALPDPCGEILKAWTRPNGIKISKIRVPIGTVGIIYESRPNVTSDAAALCLKTGNATILRGGSEAIESNHAIVAALRCGLKVADLNEDAIVMVEGTDRNAIRLLAEMDVYLDLIVPRGGRDLIESVVRHARMPVIKHFTGLCIIYLDRAADADMAERIVINAKCERPGVCNAVETLLVHRDAAAELLPRLATALQARGVEIRGDEETRILLGADQCVAAKAADWDTEFLDLILAVKIVRGLDEALAHIDHHGSHHSDAIVTRDQPAAERFLREVDSATVYWNASTRFTDGAEFGFGAEIGISTDKLHARGPMGLEELTTYKYVIRGDGQIRE